ncbi:MAG TPA: hypothetical protein VM658_07765 [bacterium]|nr:hypothetical protein [bacterium]
MRKDDLKFLAMFAATVWLSGFVVYSSYLRDLRTAAGPTVDMKRIERLVGEGRLTLHPADYWEPDGEGGK